MEYISTRGGVTGISFSEAVMMGLAEDGGLLLPRAIPRVDHDTVERWRGFSYQELAFEVMSRFIDDIPAPDLKALITDSYASFNDPAVAPMVHAGELHILELFHGPTLAFKDIALQFLGNLFAYLLTKSGDQLNIIGATSGDTGSAVAHAYHGLDRVQVVVLFPIEEVSNRQRKQMTTLGDNVTTIGIEGQFDDCQALVKRAFADPDLSAVRLTSANSINIGRLLPQAVYYFYAYIKLAQAERAEPILFSVPSGNFGDMMGGVIARRMGLPIDRLIIATNANDEVPVFLRTGRYQKISPSRVCISNAMNVGHPSNLARLVDVYGGWLDETGQLREPPDLPRMVADLYAVSISDDQTRATIKESYERFGVILEPHGAVGWAGLESYLNDHPEATDVLAVSIETAHPAKFPEEIQATIGINPELPPSLVGLEDRRENYGTMSTGYEPLRDLLLARFAGR